MYNLDFVQKFVDIHARQSRYPKGSVNWELLQNAKDIVAKKAYQ